MKKLLLIALTLLATSVHAESELIDNNAVETASEGSALIVDGQADSTEVLILSENDDNTSFWQMLDSDKDGFLSRAEAASSQVVSDNWDSLDANNDEQIDSEEFVKIYPPVN